MTKSVSVIISEYYTGAALWLAIESCFRQTACKQIIIVTNGMYLGEERKLRELATHDARIHLLNEHQQLGLARAYNLAAKVATGDYLAFFDPNCVLPAHAFAMLLEKHRYEAISGANFISADEIPLALDTKLPSRFKELWGIKSKSMPATISGCFFFLSLSLLETLKGFDEHYAGSLAITDFFQRAVNKKIPVQKVEELNITVFDNTVQPVAVSDKMHYLDTHLHPSKRQLLHYAMKVTSVARQIVAKLNRVFVPPLANTYLTNRLILLYRLAYQSGFDESLTGKRYVVTGADSATGLYLVGKLLAKGAEVDAICSREIPEFVHPKLLWQKINLKGEKEIQKVNLACDAVFHTDTMLVLPALLKAVSFETTPRIIALGDYRINQKPMLKKSAETLRIKAWQKVEKQVMEMAKAKNIPLTVLRPANLYGVGFDSSISAIADIIHRKGKMVIHGKGNGMRNPVQVKDVGEAMIAILNNPATCFRGYDIGGGEAITYRTQVEMIANYVGKPVRFLYIPLLPQFLKLLATLYQLPHLNPEMAIAMNRDAIIYNDAALQDFSYQPEAFLAGDMVL